MLSLTASFIFIFATSPCVKAVKGGGEKNSAVQKLSRYPSIERGIKDQRHREYIRIAPKGGREAPLYLDKHGSQGERAGNVEARTLCGRRAIRGEIKCRGEGATRATHRFHQSSLH